MQSAAAPGRQTTLSPTVGPVKNGNEIFISTGADCLVIHTYQSLAPAA